MERIVSSFWYRALCIAIIPFFSGQLLASQPEDESPLCTGYECLRRSKIIPVEDCCACGTAKYSLSFSGLWSRKTHPKHFPGDKAFLSSLVGASHSVNYVLWRYGTIASPGLQKMSKLGYTSELVLEMRERKDDLKSVFVTPLILGGVGSAQHSFKVDQKHPFLSGVSRISPSPDWNVGMDAIDLCDRQRCQWKSKVEMDMDVWDAGVDAGVTFTSPNNEIIPPSPIHKITPRHGNTTAGSFFVNDENLLPMAKLTLQLMRVRGDCFEKAHDADSDPDMCPTTPWSSWSLCSASCGSLGNEVRGRTRSGGDSACRMPSIRQMRSCMGHCAPPQGGDCILSSWEAWSDCSVTCGNGGVRTRTRSIVQHPSPGGQPCQKTLRMKHCNSSKLCLRNGRNSEIVDFTMEPQVELDDNEEDSRR